MSFTPTEVITLTLSFPSLQVVSFTNSAIGVSESYAGSAISSFSLSTVVLNILFSFMTRFLRSFGLTFLGFIFLEVFSFFLKVSDFVVTVKKQKVSL